MAPGTSGRDNIKEKDINMDPTIQIHEDDITEVAGANRRKNSGLEEEKLVKWQLPGHHDIVSAKRVLIQLLNDLVMTHSSSLVASWWELLTSG